MNDLRHAGDVDIREIVVINSQGVEFDITEQVFHINIYEDLFGSFINGKLVIKDSVELRSAIPLIGQEILRIDIRTPGLETVDAFSEEFYIHKMDDMVKQSERNLMYVLHFISKEAIVDTNIKVTQSFSGNIGEIVEKLITSDRCLNTIKEYNIEPTSNSFKYVSNYWTPTQNIQYCCEHALNLNNSPTYMFYENKYGLNFISMEGLYEVQPEPFMEFTYHNKKFEPKEWIEQYSQILEYRQPETFDYMKRVHSGLYASEVIYYDTLARRYVHKAFAPEFDDLPHLNDYPIWTNKLHISSQGSISSGIINYNSHDGYGDTTNVKHIQRRKTLMAQAEGHKLIIEVMGRTDYTIGQKVNVTIPLHYQHTKGNEGNSTTDDRDFMLSGNYIIAAINHVISRTNHTCMMELIKDSIILDLSYVQFPRF